MGSAIAVVQDAPYKSPESAIRNAYRIEATDIVKISSYFSRLRGSTVKLSANEMTVWDKHAQAAYILALLDRHLSEKDVLVLRARYTIASSNYLATRKLMDCRVLVNIIKAQSLSPFWYVEDVVNQWAGLRRKHTDVWWATHYEKKVREIRAWRVGTVETPGITRMLNGLLGNAESNAADPMIDAGVINAFVSTT